MTATIGNAYRLQSPLEFVFQEVEGTELLQSPFRTEFSNQHGITFAAISTIPVASSQISAKLSAISVTLSIVARCAKHCLTLLKHCEPLVKHHEPLVNSK